MLSALKKLTTNSNAGANEKKAVEISPANTSGHQTSPGINAMSSALQKKFSKGVHYNLKLLIRGCRNTGKTCLFKRLQGEPFEANYVSSDEINVASIQWNYKATDDIVKVEVWDVVDRGKKRKKLDGLKVSLDDVSPALDAEFVDVYKGTHGAIFMFDVTKSWTFDYIRQEAPKVPKHIPILVMANFIDQSHHRCITRDQAIGFIEYELDRGPEASEAIYAESSMKNGFGLKFLHRFLNLPFLSMQRESLLGQLETNSRELDATRQELGLFLESEESNYDSFSAKMTQKRRALAESLSPAPTVDVVVGRPSNTIKGHSAAKKGHENLTDTSKAGQSPGSPQKLPHEFRQDDAIDAKSTNFGANSTRFDNVDNFVPDADGIDNFLDDDGDEKMKSLTLDEKDPSDESERIVANPMVSTYDDNVEVDDYTNFDDEDETGEKVFASNSDGEDMASKVVETKAKAVKTLSAGSQDSGGGGFVFDLPEKIHSGSSEKAKKKHKKAKKPKKAKGGRSEDDERNALEAFLNGSPPSGIEPGGGDYEAL